MEYYHSFQSAPALRKYINCIWEETFFDQPVNRNVPQLIVPDNTIELVFLSGTISILKGEIEHHLGVAESSASKKKVTLKPIHSLKDSDRLESACRRWIEAVESENAEAIFSVINSVSLQGAMDPNDPAWTELARLNSELPNFRALGFRNVIDQNPPGLEVWFGSDSEEKLAIRWLLSPSDSALVENLFIMPDDMTWLGQSY